jgi:hypothetical protein
MWYVQNWPSSSPSCTDICWPQLADAQVHYSTCPEWGKMCKMLTPCGRFPYGWGEWGIVAYTYSCRHWPTVLTFGASIFVRCSSRQFFVSTFICQCLSVMFLWYRSNSHSFQGTDMVEYFIVWTECLSLTCNSSQQHLLCTHDSDKRIVLTLVSLSGCFHK